MGDWNRSDRDRRMYSPSRVAIASAARCCISMVRATMTTRQGIPECGARENRRARRKTCASNHRRRRAVICPNGLFGRPRIATRGHRIFEGVAKKTEQCLQLAERQAAIVHARGPCVPPMCETPPGVMPRLVETTLDA